jgi:hypothetical protein
MHGDDRLQQDLSARRLAAGLNRPLLIVSLPLDSGVEAALDRLYPAVRDARMLGALLYVRGGDCLIDRDGCLCQQFLRHSAV